MSVLDWVRRIGKVLVAPIVLIFYVVAGCYAITILFIGTLTDQQSDRYWQRQDEDRARRLERSRQHRRSLTQDGLRIAAQLHSTFLSRLPRELRLQVYEGYYEDSKFLVVHVKRGYHARLIACNVDANPRYRAARATADVRTVQRGLLDLTLVCKQVYAESIEFLYARNTFSLCQYSQIYVLKASFLPQRWNAISSIDLSHDTDWMLRPFKVHHSSTGRPQVRHDGWDELCETIGNMERLERLNIGSKDNYGRQNLDPLMNIRRPLKIFDVHVDPSRYLLWDGRSRWDERWRNGPFRLITPDHDLPPPVVTELLPRP